MNNRIMAMLFALVAAMFISIVPVKAEAAEQKCDHTHNYASCGYWVCQCPNETYHINLVNAGTCHGGYKTGNPCKFASHNGMCWDAGSEADEDCKCNICGKSMHEMTLVEKKDATCVATGMNEHYECEKCDGYFLKGTLEKVGATSSRLVIPVAQHTTTWVYDETEHYQKCTTEGCIGTWNRAAHEKQCLANNDGTHTWTCKVEGCEWTVENEAHVDKATDPSDLCVCDYCDAKLEHNLADWGKDINGHWKTCLTCRTNVETGAHNYGEAEAVEDKTYHVKVCEDCGFERQFDCTSADTDCLCDECGTLVKHVQANMEPVGRVEPTCDKDGNIGYNKCKTCGQAFSKNGDKYTLYTESVVLEKTGHKFGGEGYGWRETEDGTAHFKKCINGCGTNVYSTAAGVVVGEEAHSHGSWYDNKAGQHCEICAVCGESYGDEAHEYKTPVKTDVLSGAAKKQQHGLQCECGAMTYEVCTFNSDCVCEVCGSEKIHSDKSTMTYVKAKAPTCTEAGHTDYYECNTCGGTYLSDASEWDPALDALGHDWEARKDTLNGQHLQKCKRAGCGDYRTLGCEDTTGDCLCDINTCGKLIHSHKLVFHNPVAPGCETKGTEGYFTYQDCDKKMFDMDMQEIAKPVEVAATGHTPSGEWTVNEDVHEELCEDCDEVLESAEHVDENGDNRCDECDVALALELMPEQPATCTSIGYKACWVSPVSNRMYSDAEGRNHITAREVIPALGHKETGWIDQGGENHKMSCQRTGCTWSREEAHSGENDCYCEVCGGYYEGHQLYLEEMVPATCTKSGTQAYYECECGDKFDLDYNPISAPKAIAQLKHVMDPTVKKDVKEGKHYIQCKDCSYKLYENHGMELSDPNKGNYHQWLCECGELKIETHYDKNGDKKCDVCGHNMGTTSTKVEQHDNKTVYTGQSGSVNVHKDWFWNWQEWFTPSNSGGSSTTVTESATESNTANSGTATGNTATGNTTTGSTATGNTASGNTTTGNTASNNSGNTSTPTVSAPAATQTNVLVQFVNWFLGLFGF